MFIRSIWVCLLKRSFKNNRILFYGKQYENKKWKNNKIKNMGYWGQETYHSMALNTMKLTKGIMFLYEVSKRESFTNIKEKWIPQIEDILDTSK